MKKVLIFLTLLLILTLPTILALTPSPIVPVDEFNNPIDLTSKPKPTTNPWNETIIISPTWQTLIGTFFGLNLKNVSTKISVRETLVLLSIFIMFLVIILDILKLTPFFKINIGPISGESIAALIITTLVSISGALINLKDLFIGAVAHTVESLNFSFMAAGSVLTAALVLVSFTFIILFFNMISPIIKRYSQVSKAQASGRHLRSSIETHEE